MTFPAHLTNAPQIAHEHTPTHAVRFHEYAALFPMLQGAPLDALRDDIGKHGVREPIVFLDDAILDGRNRYMCARDLGLDYPRREFGSAENDGSDALAFVISHNLHRRHLTESQRAMIAAKLAKMKPGDNQHTGGANLPNHKQAADMLSVSPRSVKTAKKVEREGAPELVEQVELGNVSVSAAADVADLPKEEQAEIVASVENEILEHGDEASKAELRRSIFAVIKNAKKRPRKAKNPLHRPDPAADAVGNFTDACEEIAEIKDISAIALWGERPWMVEQALEKALAAKSIIETFLKLKEKENA